MPAPRFITRLTTPRERLPSASRFRFGAALLLVGLGLLPPVGTLRSQNPGEPDPITQTELREHVAALAGEDFAGRGTGQPGFLKAARYLAREFHRLGLTAAGAAAPAEHRAVIDTWLEKLPADERAYFQPFIAPRGVTEPNVPACNVIARLPGAENDPLAQEAVVIGAHFDHLGVQNGATHYGADDNASGTAGLLEIAEFLTTRGKNRRTVLFIAFGAEEVGVQGSQWYVDHPTIPLEATVAMLNLDMIGRKFLNTRQNRVACVGGETSDLLKEYATRAFAAQELTTQWVSVKLLHKLWGMSSDHYRFHEREVPVIYLSTSTHPDYHKPSDTADKLEYGSMTRIARAAAMIATAATEVPKRPEWKTP